MAQLLHLHAEAELPVSEQRPLHAEACRLADEFGRRESLGVRRFGQALMLCFRDVHLDQPIPPEDAPGHVVLLRCSYHGTAKRC